MNYSRYFFKEQGIRCFKVFIGQNYEKYIYSSLLLAPMIWMLQSGRFMLIQSGKVKPGRVGSATVVKSG